MSSMAAPLSWDEVRIWANGQIARSGAVAGIARGDHETRPG
jgi:hypothetical protein